MALNERFRQLKIRVLPEEFSYYGFDKMPALLNAMARLEASPEGKPYFVFRGAQELSLIAPLRQALSAVREEPGWTCLQVLGELKFGTVQGLIATLTGELKEHGIGVCVVSSFDTDHFFVRLKRAEEAIRHLQAAGWTVITAGSAGGHP